MRMLYAARRGFGILLPLLNPVLDMYRAMQRFQCAA